MKPRNQGGRQLTKLEREALEKIEKQSGKYPEPGIAGEHPMFLERVDHKKS